MMMVDRAMMAAPLLLLLHEPLLGFAPKLVQDIARSIVAIIRGEKVSVLLVEQFSPMALSISYRANALSTDMEAILGVSKERHADKRV